MKRRCLVFLSAAFFALAASVRAANLLNVLADYSVTSWGLTDGLPASAVWAIAQDEDGYLWLGTDAGLVRFDGLTFLRWTAPPDSTPLPERPVRALEASRDGTLWIGFGDEGGVAQIRSGAVLNDAAEPAPVAGPVTAIVEDAVGRVWVARHGGVDVFSERTWRQWTAGLPDETVYSVHAAADGSVAVGTDTGVFVLEAGADRFEPLERVSEYVRSISRDSEGRWWITDSESGFRPLGAFAASARAVADGRGSRLLHDSRGNLWVGTRGQGLWRVRLDEDTGASAIERATSQTGLLGEGLQTMFEDREGNIWAGTLDGVNRLTPHKVTPIVDLGLVSGVEATPDGRVWVGALHELVSFAPGDRPRRDTALPLSQSTLSALHRDERGTVWLSTGPDLRRVDGDRVRAVPVRGVRLRDVAVIASDGRGGLWLYDVEQGLLRWRDGDVALADVPAVSPSRGQVLAMHTDRAGRTWLALAEGGLIVLAPDGSLDTVHRGLAGGAYRAIYEADDGVVWLGASGGLTRYADGRFDTVSSTGALPAGSVTAIVEDEAGHLWLGTDIGILRLQRSEFDRALADASYQMHFQVYDKYDGSAGTTFWYGNRGATRAADGRLWFVGSRGVSIVDPRDLGDARLHVPVRIEGVAANDRYLPAGGDVRLPPRTNALTIHYTALNLTAPLRTKFRYRLDGVDPQWVEAGSRRQATYANLPPRRYRFLVMADTDQGAWAEPPAVWEFAIQPPFYETTWFALALALTLALVVWAAWQMRLRQVRRQFSILLGERARLSREIHDTLLQGLFGVALRCDAIATDVEAAAPQLKGDFVQMRDDINEYIRDARQSIWNLRPPSSNRQDLPILLRDVGEHLTAPSGVAFRLAVQGSPRAFANGTDQQLLRIAREAVTNAVRHAHAREVRMELEYEADTVRLRVSDDGSGFDAARVADADGHYGLTGMKERAAGVRGAVLVQSAVGEGTRVEVSVPYA